MKPTFKIIPDTRRIKKNGEVPFYIRVTINRRSKLWSLDTSFPFPDVIKFYEDPLNHVKTFPNKLKHWDENECRIRLFPNVNKMRLEQVNQKLVQVDISARTLIHDFDHDKKVLYFDVFEKEVLNPGIKINEKSFYEFCESEIAYMAASKKPTETVRTFSTLVSKLKQYKDPLNFDDITLKFVRDYHSYMLNDLKNMQNTCSKMFRFMRNMLNRAILQKIITENVFDRFTIKTEPGHREHLSANELKEMEDLLAKGTGKNYLDNVLKYFLFTCYTGLRYQDLKKLRFKDMYKTTENGNEATMIRIIMHKTKEPVAIPLRPKAIALIGEMGFVNQEIFRVSANQVTNRHLKEIVKMAKIEKKITFHCARHTLANHLLDSDWPLELIRDILGHTDLKTTKIYAKYSESKKIEYMRNLD